jgi:tetratricopeptide (TPR) repeat protein
MKAKTRTLGIFLLMLLTTATFAQRKITGTVYIKGEPAAGIQVDANKTNSSYYTSFDGKYELQISEKTKYLKFTFLDDSKKLDITNNTSDVIDFSWDGQEIPEASEAGIILKTSEQLQKERDMEFLNNYSLYREFYKQNDFKSAFPHWKTVYHVYPKSTAQIYIDGLKMYESMMDKALDSKTKYAYLDTIMMIYDKRIKYMDNVGELMGWKAAKYLGSVLTLDLSDEELKKDIKTGYGFAEKSINKSGVNSEAAVMVLFMQSTKRLFAYNEFPKAKVIENYEMLSAIIDEQLKSETLKEKAAQAAPIIDQIVESSGAMDCATMIDLYTAKFNQNPNDTTQIKKMVKMLRKEKCTDSEIYEKAAEKAYELEPSAEAAFNMANMFVKKENPEKAAAYYEKAYTKESDPATKATYYYYAGMYSLQNGKLQQARTMATEAIKLKSDYCEAYMLLGETYAQASKSFSSDEFEKVTVFWLAVDNYEKASRYSNCKSDGESKASFYRNYFPNKEDVFFRSLSEGSKYTVAGWINETTTVRAKK